ncbi:DUF6745 domain-containing protein [Actinoplanes derwentensis]|uniref:DUF6745 domain-containing protein n=1 Tax=Actinoplanes derwentensis TaxID=113562 RepID=A0A1H1SLK6_9ACTN|nr:hypothetical protein [Actinoplanes derwentensis]GID83283.1 hypothetical protein Ade03nite_22070 [Actinoplanes derwentensis]SDS48259.1 hypothetical protein SAMN04489716_0881 [Actinoplanes derwentensis]
MRLTHDQEAMAAAIEDQWLATGVATGPAERETAEAGVRFSYAQAGLAPPDRVYWFGSPRAGAAAAALMSGALTPGPGVPAWFIEVHDELRRQGWTPQDDVGRSVRRQVRTEPWAAARRAALETLGPDGWAQLSAAAGRRSWGLVMDLIAGRVRVRLGEDLAADLGPAARTTLLDAIYGQHDGTWLSTFEAAGEVDPAAGLTTRLGGLAAVARQAGWWWAHERAAVLTERPTLLARDNVGRMHRGEGAAMEFPDGYGLWAWRGMPIPSDLAAELPALTVERIRREENAEVRRVMLEHFGYERYLREAGARKQGTDETGTLWWLDLPGDEPLVMVEVVNSTPEPDGTSRVYWLRVPPRTRSARAGVAWTFGLTEEEYQPLLQT